MLFLVAAGLAARVGRPRVDRAGGAISGAGATVT
jgi:hypothetical protein